MNNKIVKPMIMQLAEEEYMCECGYKFYGKKDKCFVCGVTFNYTRKNVEIKNMNKYDELKQLVNDNESNRVWVRNKISLSEQNGSITYKQKEELLTILENR